MWETKGEYRNIRVPPWDGECRLYQGSPLGMESVSRIKGPHSGRGVSAVPRVRGVSAVPRVPPWDGECRPYQGSPLGTGSVGRTKSPRRDGVRGEVSSNIYSVYLSVHSFVFCLFVCPFPFLCLSIVCLSVCLSICLCLSVCLSPECQYNGMTVCGVQPHKSLPSLVAQIKDRDKAVCSAALNTTVWSMPM